LDTGVHFLCMSEDPSIYAPPEAEESVDSAIEAPLQLPETPIGLSFDAVLGTSWNFAKRNLGKFFLYGLSLAAIYVIPYILIGFAFNAESSSLAGVGLLLILLLAMSSLLFVTGFISGTVKLAKTGSIEFKDFFKFNFIACLKLIGLLIIVYLALALVMVVVFGIFAGIAMAASGINFEAINEETLATLGLPIMVLGSVLYLALVVFMAYVYARFGYTFYVMIEQGAGMFESVKYSWRLTKGTVWTHVGLYIVLMLIYYVSIIPFGIGLLWSIPMLYMAPAISYVYMHTGRTVLPR